jgi:hypothetical protein
MRQRLRSSSSTSIAVVVKKIITGPWTWYSCVTSFPVTGSFPVLAIVSCPSLCRSFSAYDALCTPCSSATAKILCARSVSPM